MALETTTIQDIVLVMIPRRMDAGNAPGLESDFRTIMAGSPKKMILDFSGTDYIASAGLRVLLLITRDLMKAGGRVALAGLRPAVYKVFEMAGFTSIFTMSKSREDAIRTLQ